MPERCPGCDGADFGAEGYCETCGQRRPAGEDHSELDLGEVAGVTDRGRRVHRNEDALGLAVRPDCTVAVVCDGVGSSTRPDAASHAAVDAALPALLAVLDRDGVGGRGDRRRHPRRPGRGRAGRRATAGEQPAELDVRLRGRPSGRVTVGWVGDSRAYWLPADGPAECLTTDDAVPGRFAAEPPPAAAPADAAVDPAVDPASTVDAAASAAGDVDGAKAAAPAATAVVAPLAELPENAGALLRWLGADAPDTEPHLRTLTPTGPGRVLVCSDGLFRYSPPTPGSAEAAPAGAPLASAQALVQLGPGRGRRGQRDGRRPHLSPREQQCVSSPLSPPRCSRTSTCRPAGRPWMPW